MACVLCQFDLPQEPAELQAYSEWVVKEGINLILDSDGLTEMRVFRNLTGGSPQVTALIFFKDASSALRAASSTGWHALVTALTRYHCRDVTLTLLGPSPLFPESLRPRL